MYSLLVNRSQFQREQLTQPHQQSVCTTRALLCELLANRILRRFHEDNPGHQGLLLLAQILVEGFDPFQGAPSEVAEENSHLSCTIKTRTGYKRKLPALEIAIISESKIFLSSSACQMVVNAIFEGRVIYTPTSFVDILPDHYKQKPISLYNPRKAPLFNQYRLIVPRTRNILEVCQFIVLLILFLFVMVDRDPTRFGLVELAFIIYTLGWTLDQFVSLAFFWCHEGVCSLVYILEHRPSLRLVPDYAALASLEPGNCSLKHHSPTRPKKTMLTL